MLYGPSPLQRDWPARMARVAALVRRRAPDVVALQEVSEDAAELLARELPDYALEAGPLSGASTGLRVASLAWSAAVALLALAAAPGARAWLVALALLPWVEVAWMRFHLGRFGSRGAHAALLWRRERLEREGAQAWWLSRTPDRPGSTLPLTLGPRMVHGVRLRDRASGRQLFVCATHIGHAPWAAAASARIVLGRLADERTPVQLLCGDFNATPASPLLRALCDGRSLDPPLRDARVEVAPRAPAAGTWPAGAPRLALDHILVRGPVRIAAFETLGGPEDLVSDHRALEVELTAE